MFKEGIAKHLPDSMYCCWTRKTIPELSPANFIGPVAPVVYSTPYIAFLDLMYGTNPMKPTAAKAENEVEPKTK